LYCDLGVHNPSRLRACGIQTLNQLSGPYLDDFASRLVDLHSPGGSHSVPDWFEPSLFKD
jgi:hypothetical protein